MKGAAAPEPPPGVSGPAGGGDGAWTVSRLAAEIAGAMDRHMPAKLRVLGEVSGLRERTHLYFAVKDAEAVVNAVMFASVARRSGPVEDGREYVFTGSVEFYAPQGRVSFIVDRAEAVGVGRLEQRFRELCDELRAQGLFEQDRKRPVPTFPRRVAVITSPTGAALQDVIDTAARRCRAVELVTVGVRVQGDAAAGEVVRALERVNAHRRALGIDAIVLTRGGGSMEDLWAFNEREVAEAIARSELPVVAAIGHETDTTIAELVADVRCATPTQAAMRITPDAEALARQVESLRHRLGLGSRRTLELSEARLRAASRHRVFADPGGPVRSLAERTDSALRRLRSAAVAVQAERASVVHRLERALERHRPAAAQARRETRLVYAAERLKRAMARRLERDAATLDGLDLRAPLRRSVSEEVERVASLERELEAVGPVAVLRRGFSCTTDADGRLVRSPTDVSPGDRLRTRLADGSIESEVIGDGGSGREMQAGSSPKPQAAPARQRTRRPGAKGEPGRDQLDLFGGGR